jgi:hypothetical protein
MLGFLRSWLLLVLSPFKKLFYVVCPRKIRRVLSGGEKSDNSSTSAQSPLQDIRGSIFEKLFIQKKNYHTQYTAGSKFCFVVVLVEKQPLVS